MLTHTGTNPEPRLDWPGPGAGVLAMSTASCPNGVDSSSHSTVTLPPGALIGKLPDAGVMPTMRVSSVVSFEPGGSVCAASLMARSPGRIAAR